MLITREKNITVLGNGLYLGPVPSGSFSEQVRCCYEQLDGIMSAMNRHVAMVIYFIYAKTREEYDSVSAELDKLHRSAYASPYSIIAQEPADGTMVNLEIHHCCERANPVYGKFEGFPYCTFSYDDNRYLISGGLRLKDPDAGLQDQSRESFRLMKGILEKEGMDFSNVFRQWNYIESITGDISGSQRYQIFNDVRSEFYSTSDFSRGYPAATGIGMITGGAIIDFLAAIHGEVWPVRNPKQVDAHHYSKEVLAENELSANLKKTTPKFERAKAIAFGQEILLYVSGTAAIKGEQSFARDDVYRQTLLTIDNIEQLTDLTNLRAHGIPLSDESQAEPVSFKVYIKSPSDVEKVQAAMNLKFGSMKNVLYLIGDICRPELLMEIEGTYWIGKG